MFSGVMSSPIPKDTPIVSCINILEKTPAPAAMMAPLGAFSLDKYITAGVTNSG